jgi:glycosyltransferase involved in cell wall biosynthesis
MLTILMPGSRHLSNFNKPRYSRHKLLFPNKPLFFDKFEQEELGHILLGVATWNPLRYPWDIIHSFNEVPITNKPGIGTFECEIPRTIGRNEEWRKKLVRKLLLRKNCIKIVSLSRFGVKRAEDWNSDWDFLSEMMKKVEVIHPTVPLKNRTPKQHNGEQIRLVFCGKMFAQKCGIVALRLAKLAYQSNFPLQVDIVSSMDTGWTDVADKSRYEPDFKLLDLPNVTYHSEMQNPEVIDLFAVSDFQILATLHDTYGYSVIEGFSVGTPAIVTATCALPEIVRHQENGFLLNVDVDELNEIRWLGTKSQIWDRIDAGLLLTDEYWETQDKTYHDLAQQAFDILQLFMTNTHDYERLSQNAITQVINCHNAEMISEYFDSLYEEIYEETR